jgi:hypothetical protein
LDLADTHVSPGRLLDFHDAMLSHVQDDERVRRAWEESNSADRRCRRGELGRQWLEHHSCMQALHSDLPCDRAEDRQGFAGSTEEKREKAS